ncbi:acyl-CoA thioesterase [Rhodobacter sp. NTK016B]|uniref:acyl-CoA thioesterase n=1 Tax=Rhodobacter sp. NTK016B TaxID=2759676 RepID=UPI001A8F8AF9|nr:acyl-CoA thioesterase [Rhodobacter sp. NTK016B]MBN8293477.1 acyl-CoA thioesterase [Rhodobacter sp. NTK016B]
MSSTHDLTYTVTFGDCDPAGIVFYPNIYGWFDRCFHDWLGRFGGHAAICKEVGAVGAGLMQADAVFRRPMRPNDTISVSMTIREWGRKSLTLDYQIRLGETVTATGTEVRGLFKPGEKGIVAGEMHELKDAIARHEG